MTATYRHVSIPRRGRFYFAFGVGLMFAYWLHLLQAPLLVLLPLGFFLSAVIWFAFRDPPAGMEIGGGEWRFFVGRRSWSVPLREIASVRMLPGDARNRALQLRYRDGHVDRLPPVLAPEPHRLSQVLAQRGIAVEG